MASKKKDIEVETVTRPQPTADGDIQVLTVKKEKKEASRGKRG